MINVTKTSMPDFEEYCKLIKPIWDSRMLTNNGDYLRELECKIANYLELERISLVSNGTLALNLALELFDFLPGDEIITSPFTFVASSSSIVWQKYKPVFIDIDPITFNINPENIESAITDKTRAILAIHVFGNPCLTESIDKIAKKHNLKVIYDAAHSFGIKYKSKNILLEGDVSTLSFHATKVFHTIEGGAIICSDKDLHTRANRFRTFGFEPSHSMVIDNGINAKMNEFQAAMGLLNIELIDHWIAERKIADNYYRELLSDNIKFQKLSDEITEYNYIYFPILLDSFEKRETIHKILFDSGFNARKYFYPIVNEFDNYKSIDYKCPIAKDISERILLLPIYPNLEFENIKKICDIINNNL